MNSSRVSHFKFALVAVDKKYYGLMMFISAIHDKVLNICNWFLLQFDSGAAAKQ